MLLFNKPKIDEKEHMIQQRKKASFNSKCAKFEGGKEPILVKQDSITKVIKLCILLRNLCSTIHFS